MKLLFLFVVLIVSACKPEKEAARYGVMLKPLAGAGAEYTTPEETGVQIHFEVDTAKNPQAVDLTWAIVSPPKHGDLSGCDKRKLSITCLYTPRLDFNGTDQIHIKAKDGDFLSDEDSVISINVTPVPDVPILGANQSEQTPENTAVFFNLNNASDVDSSQLNYEVVAASTQNGSVQCHPETGLCEFTPDQDFYGVATFEYQVKDETELYADGVGLVEIKVLDFPEVGDDQQINITQNIPKVFAVNQASDNDSTALIYELVSMPTQGVLFNCLVMMGEDLSCEYRPNLGFTGSDSLTYQVRDSDNLVSHRLATISFNVAEPNAIPSVGANQLLDTLEEEAVSFQVSLGSDLDHRDASTEPNLTYIVSSIPTKGVLSNCFMGPQDRNCTYTPNPGVYATTDSFTYLVQDEQQASSLTMATVTINIIKKNRIPQVGADQTEETLEEDPITFVVNAGTDEDHTDPNTDAELKYIVASQPQNGTLSNCFSESVDFTRGFGLEADRTCTYTPNAGFYDQADSFTYLVMDAEDQSVNTATVTINVVKKNRIPQVGQDQTFELEIDPNQTPEAFTFVANAGTDEDHMDPNTDAELKYIVATQPLYGTLTNCFSDAVDFTRGFGLEADRTCTYTPNQGEYDKTDFITYYVMDATDQSVTTAKISFVLDKKNQIPQVGADQTEETLEEDPITFVVNAGTDEDHTDPNTDAELKYIVASQPQNGTLSNCFSESVDFTRGFGLEADRTCTYTPNAGFYDQADSFTYLVMDAEDQSVNTATVTINVVKKNRIPQVGANQAFEVYDDEALTFIANPGTDEDHMDPNTDAELLYVMDPNQTLQYGQLSNCFPPVDFTRGFGEVIDRTCTYTPNPGSYGNTEVLSYYVMDQADMSVNMATISILIKARNAKPTVGANQTLTGYINVAINFEVNEGDDAETAKENLVYEVEGMPTNGQLNADCLTMASPDQRKCTYTPNPDWSGTDSMTYSVIDENGAKSDTVATVTFNIVDYQVLCQNAISEGTVLSSTTNVLFQQNTDSNGEPISCTYNQNGNGAPKEGRIRAREEYYQQVEIPAGAILCDADFVFFPDENGVSQGAQNFYYDDELFLTLNNYVLMSTVDYSTDNAFYPQYQSEGLTVTANGLVEYRWLDDGQGNNGIYDLDYRQSGTTWVGGTYCLGIPHTAPNYMVDCQMPATQMAGDVQLNIPNDKIIEVGALSIAPQDPNSNPNPTALDFGFIATGDNEIDDCEFSDFNFNVTLKYIMPVTNN